MLAAVFMDFVTFLTSIILTASQAFHSFPVFLPYVLYGLIDTYKVPDVPPG